MRKKDCLGIRELKLSRDIKAAAQNAKYDIIQHYSHWDGWYNSIHYEHTAYYRATVGKDILKVAIWLRASVLNDTKPDYEIYISKKEEKWLTYMPKTEEWRTARIDNLGICADGDCYGVKVYASKTTEGVISAYLEKQYAPREAILKYQLEVMAEIAKQNNRKELDRIDSIMVQVPELPKDFEDWARNDAMTGAHYIIYDKKQKTAKCTRCGSDVPFKKIIPTHNLAGKCPVCHKPIQYKSAVMQKTLNDKRYFVIIQKLKDKSGYIARYFYAWQGLRREKDYKKEFGIHEDFRILLGDRFSEIDSFEWGEYKKTGETRWIQEKYNWMVGYHTRAAVIYPRNLKRVFKDTLIQYIPFNLIFDRRKGKEMHISLFNSLTNFTQAEMLLKLGLDTLTMDMINRSCVTGGVDCLEKKPWRYLKVTKEGMNQLIRIDGGISELETIRSAEKFGVKLTDEQVEWYTGIGGGRDRLLSLGMPGKFMRYFEEYDCEDKKALIRDYYDFLRDVEYLGIEMKKSMYFPKDFYKVHEEIAEERAEREKEIEKADLKKKNRILRKLLPELKELYAAENDEFVIVFPTKKADFQNEGRQQHNCVGGAYFDYMIKKECCVVFLRKKSDPDKSFATVEFAPDGSVRQNRIINNQNAPQEAWEFIKEVSNEAKKKMREKQKEALKRLEAV